jgi:hypothetical protein
MFCNIFCTANSKASASAHFSFAFNPPLTIGLDIAANKQLQDLRNRPLSSNLKKNPHLLLQLTKRPTLIVKPERALSVAWLCHT